MTEQDTRAAPGQWKTLREIADEIGTGKMNVYRYAKTAGLEGVTLPGAGNGQKRFYDVTAQMQPPAALPEEITPQDKPPTLWQRLFGKKG